MIWGRRLRAFSPRHPVQEFPHLHCPLFYVLSVTLALPEPCKVYKAAPLCPRASAPRGWPPARRPHALHPLSHADLLTWDRCFIPVSSLGVHGPTQRLIQPTAL